jgi:integrase
MIDVIRRYRYVVQDRDRRGTIRTYLRLPGKPKVRLHEKLGTDEFDAEYRAALEAKPKPKKATVGVVVPGSIDDLCVAYYGSLEFRKKLDARSQRVRRNILDRFRATLDKKGIAYGSKQAGSLPQPFLERLKDERAATPEAFNSLLKALRAVFKAAIRLGKAKTNPALNVEYLPSNNPNGFATWDGADIAKFEARHPIGTMPRLALALLLYTGQRRSDVVQLGRQHLRDGELRFTQVKGRRKNPMPMCLPVVRELQAVLDATPNQGRMTFLANQNGTPFTAETFGNAFRRWCREAGVTKGLAAHGLRKAVGARLAENDATTHEIMATLGHRTLKEAERYTRAASRRVMAGKGLARLSTAEAEKAKVPPGAGTAEWDENVAQTTDKKGLEEWMVPRAGIEPATLRFSVACSTN